MTIEFKCKECQKDISILIPDCSMIYRASVAYHNKICFRCVQEIRRAEYKIMQSRQSAKMWVDEFSASQTPSEV